MKLPGKVLIVESDSSLQEKLQTTLTTLGYQVLCLEDGLAAANMIREELFDLVVLDLLLPGMNGIALAEIAKDRSEGRVRVLMLSSLGSTAHRDLAYASGVDVVLQKPFSRRTLIEASRVLCPTVKHTQANEQAIGSDV